MSESRLLKILSDGKLKNLGDDAREAVQAFGPEPQLRMVLEETAELQQAVCKLSRYGADEEHRAYVAEEVADVLIVLEQLLYMNDLDGLVLGTMEAKLARLNKQRNKPLSYPEGEE